VVAQAISQSSPYQKAAVAASVALAGFLILDPVVLGAVREFDSGTYHLFRGFTNLGRSNWILIPSGAGILVLAWMRAKESGFRRAVAYGYAMQLLSFLFAAVALSGLSASLIKNVLGRARPKLFEQVGPIEFQPFSFDADFASFPSGHATTAGALAGVLAIVWPGARIPLFLAGAWIASTRFLIGAHYLSDVVAGLLFGVAFAYFLRNRLARRRWLFANGRDGKTDLRGRMLLDRAAAKLFQGGRRNLALLSGFVSAR
jgi:membrane-associated phospholipid phosphatase